MARADQPTVEGPPLTLSDLDTALAARDEFAAANAPMDPVELAQRTANLATNIQALIPDDETLGIYQEEMEQWPAWIVCLAFRRIIQTWCYENFPRLGQISAKVAPELLEWRLHRNVLEGRVLKLNTAVVLRPTWENRNRRR